MNKIYTVVDGGKTFAQLLDVVLGLALQGFSAENAEWASKYKNYFILYTLKQTLKQTVKARVRCSSWEPGDGTRMAYIAVTDAHWTMLLFPF